ncbi:MAG: hypothetical protein JWO41_96 [Candidatus Saccharibacteria bacterium]|nr:hypothetical protein [Candidatus Saccharibacteria bacterium]
MPAAIALILVVDINLGLAAALSTGGAKLSGAGTTGAVTGALNCWGANVTCCGSGAGGAGRGAALKLRAVGVNAPRATGCAENCLGLSLLF